MTGDGTGLFTIAMRDLDEKFSSDLMDESWRTFNCAEIDALVEVLITGSDLIGEHIAGQRAARMVLGQHAMWDEDGDQHHYPVGKRVQYTGNGVLHGRYGTVTEGNDGVGLVTVDWGGGEVGPVHVIDLEIKEVSHD